MDRTNKLIITGMFMLGIQAEVVCSGAGEAFYFGGFVRAPEGALDIAKAPAPLFCDPVFNGAADPSVVWNTKEKAWYIFYTQRRANLELTNGESWYMGTKIGIAKSADQCRSWSYAGPACRSLNSN